MSLFRLDDKLRLIYLILHFVLIMYFFVQFLNISGIQLTEFCRILVTGVLGPDQKKFLRLILYLLLGHPVIND